LTTTTPPLYPTHSRTAKTSALDKIIIIIITSHLFMLKTAQHEENSGSLDMELVQTYMYMRKLDQAFRSETLFLVTARILTTLAAYNLFQSRVFFRNVVLV